MSWQLLVGISVLLFSFNNLFHRVLMKDEASDPYAQFVMFYGLGGLFSFIITLFHGGFHYQLTLSQLPFFLLLTVFATAAPILAFKAAKIIEASESTILLSSYRLWLVIGAFLFLGEAFSWKKILGTIIVLIGVAIAQWRKNKFVINHGAVYILFAALCYAIADVVSFNILKNFEAVSFNVYLGIFTVIPLLLVRPKTLKKLSFYLKPKYAVSIVAVTMEDTTATILIYFAYQMARNASQISPIMATQTILSVILAALILKERDNMVNKLIGAAVVVIGVILVL